MSLYEGMFLLNAAEASRDWDAAQARVTDLLVRHGAEIKRAEKWAERKLAYDIAGQSKGVYLLVFFDVPTESIEVIRGDCRLQRDYIIREMILRKDESALEKPTFSDNEVAAAEKARRMMSRPKPEHRDEKPADGKSGKTAGKDETSAQEPVDKTGEDERELGEPASAEGAAESK